MRMRNKHNNGSEDACMALGVKFVRRARRTRCMVRTGMRLGKGIRYMVDDLALFVGFLSR